MHKTNHIKSLGCGKIRLILLLTASVLFICPQGTFAAAQADIAIAAVKQMISSGRVSPETSLSIVAKQGNIDNFLGKDYELKNEWEDKTGIILDFKVMPQKPVLDFLKENDTVDIMIARQREYPDLVSGNLIADLTRFLDAYGIRLDGNPDNGYILPEIQSEFDNKVVAIPADGDIAVLYLRRDMLNDALKRETFRKRYNRELNIPETWDEYQDLVEFFHDPGKGFYGSCEEREPHTGWMFWVPRYASRTSSDRYMFDEDMRPLINSPEGIAATKSYLKTIPYSPPDILKEGNNYSYTVPIFKRGKGFAHIITPAGAKIYNVDSSKVKDKFMAVPMPGTVVNGRLVRRSTFIYGNNLVVPASSENKELAFLYAIWLTDPDISERSINVKSGFADPYRYNHMKSENVRRIYTKQSLENLRSQIDLTMPAGTGLPGDTEYIEALSHNLWLAGKGKQTAEEAMKNTADEWEKITERHGRQKQIRYWKAFRKKFPE